MKSSKRVGLLSPAMLWLATGCAATAPAYVTPVPVAQPAREAQVDERVAAVEKRVNEMGQRVQTLEGGVAGAQRRADEAARKAEGVDSRLTRLWSNRFNQKTADSLEVYFSPDSIDLSDAAQTALTSVVAEMKAHPTLTVELGGYTDPRGALAAGGLSPPLPAGPGHPDGPDPGGQPGADLQRRHPGREEAPGHPAPHGGSGIAGQRTACW